MQLTLANFFFSTTQVIVT